MVHLTAVQRVLSMFVQGLVGRPLHLKPIEALQPGSRPTPAASDAQSIHLPASLDSFDVAADNWRAYRIAALHQIGYLQFGTYEFELIRARQQMALPERLEAEFRRARAASTSRGPALLPRWIPDLERLFEAMNRPALARRVFTTVEDLRIDTAVRRHYPGARRDLDRVLALARAARPLLDGLRPLARLIECLVRYSLGEARDLLSRDLSSRDLAPLAAILDAAATVESETASVYTSAQATLLICDLLERWMTRPLRARAEGSSEEFEIDTLKGLPNQTPGQPMALPQTDLEIEGQAQPADEDFDGPGIDFRGELLPGLMHRHLRHGQVGSILQDYDLQMAPTDLELTGDEAIAATVERRRAIAIARQASAEGPRSFLYDEWNYRSLAYERAWCRVYEERLRGEDGEFVDEVRRRHAGLAGEVKRRFAAIRPESWQRVHRTSDGDELELDGLIEAVIDRRAGHATDEHLYIRRDRALREVAAAFLVDMSASTDFPVRDKAEQERLRAQAEASAAAQAQVAARQARTGEYGPYLYGGYDDSSEPAPAGPKRRVIDVSKEALVVMADALHRLGDSHAIYGFSGEGRKQVEFKVAKDFNDPISPRVWSSLAAMEPRRSTRMGPAIRHASAKLARQPVRRKVLIMISDGYPQDSDYGPDRDDEEYGIQDSARALQEAEQRGITTFCITIDPAGNDYLRRMCPDNRYMVIDDVNDLPGELVKVYRALTLPGAAD